MPIKNRLFKLFALSKKKKLSKTGFHVAGAVALFPDISALSQMYILYAKWCPFFKVLFHYRFLISVLFETGQGNGRVNVTIKCNPLLLAKKFWQPSLGSLFPFPFLSGQTTSTESNHCVSTFPQTHQGAMYNIVRPVFQLWYSSSFVILFLNLVWHYDLFITITIPLDDKRTKPILSNLKPNVHL